MDNALRFWRNSIFTRLMMTFVIIIAPLYLIALNIYNWGIHNVKQEMDGSMRSQMTFYLNNLETEFQRISTLLNGMLYDDNLNDLAYKVQTLDGYQRSKAINSLQQRLIVLQNSNLYIQGITAYVPSAGIDVSANGGMGDHDRSAYLYLNQTKPMEGTQLLIDRGQLLMTAVMPINLQYRISHNIPLLSVTLSQERISRTLQQLDTSPGSGAILFSPGSDIRLADPANAGETDRWIQEAEAAVAGRDGGNANGSYKIKLDGRMFYMLYMKSSYLNMAMVKYVPAAYLTQAAHKFQLMFWLFSLVSAIIIVIFSLSTFQFIQQPMLKLVRSLRQLEKGNLNITIEHQRKDEFGYLYHRFNEMARHVNHLIEQVYKQQIMTQRAELKQLQSQINPHFLYNTYFVLYNMAMSDDLEHVKLFTKKLGSYFQYITRNAADEVALELEAQNAGTYCDIQSIRFYNRLTVDFGDLPESLRQMRVPRLILQPLIENAFEHGLENRKSQGLLVVRFLPEAAGAVVTVEDNGLDADDGQIRRMQESLEKSGEEQELTGLVNIHRRIRLKFGPDSGLSVDRSELGGLRITLRMQPKREA